MFRLFDYANAYIRRATWKDFALLKICLLALGLLFGLALPNKARKPVGVIAAVLFVLTYIPVMGKFLQIGSRKEWM